MKLLNYFTALTLLTTASLPAYAQLLCESRLTQNENTERAVLESSRQDGLTSLEAQISGYAVKVAELISKDPSQPTLLLEIKKSGDIILSTMTPSPGEQSGNPYVRTDIRLANGYLTVKCIMSQRH